MYCESCGKENEDSTQFCIFCGETIDQTEKDIFKFDAGPKKKKNGLISLIKKLLPILGTTLIILGIVSVVFSNSLSSDQVITKEINNTKTVVNIQCDKSGGSGTIITEDGLILTNEHVVSGEEVCLVTIPDVLSGEPVEIYYATPYIYPELSEQYDIAILEIYGVYTDKDGISWGEFPNKFTYFQTPKSCTDNPWKLGEPVKIYGYPVTSYNYNLTITEGIISNFDGGYILTSAKIDSGNSGGLAINQEGCMLGMPSAVLEGDYQNLGVIIPQDVIWEFFDKVTEQLESSDTDILSSSHENKEKPTLKPTMNIIPTISNNGIKTREPYESSDEHINPINVEALGDGKVKVSWNKLNREVLYYIVDYGTSSGNYNFSTPAGNSDSIEIGSLESGRMYFRVKGGWHEPNSVWKYAYSEEISMIVK